MKRTIASTVPILALLIGAGHASGQPQPDRVALDPATEQFLRAEQSAAYRLEKLLKPYYDNRQAPPQELREKIRPIVEESFQARQHLQRLEVEALRRRLADIEQTIDNREKNKEAIINSRVEDALNRKTFSKDGQSRPGNDPNSPPKGPTRTSDAAANDLRLTPREQDDGPDFDLDTRGRLAELDLQRAEEEYQAAANELSEYRKLRDARAISETEFRMKEKDQRLASIELKRAKVKLEGIARQRAELEANADAAVLEATIEESKAATKLPSSEADFEAAKAAVTAAEANVASAMSNREYRTKEYERVKKLVTERSIEPKLLDKSEEQLDAAKKAVDAANAALVQARAIALKSQSAIAEVRAEVNAAGARLSAAKAARKRLGKHNQPEAVDPTAATGGRLPAPAGASKVLRTLSPTDEPISADAKWVDGQLRIAANEAGIQRLFEVPLPRVDQSMITYRFRIQTEELKSSVYPEMWCRVEGFGEAFSRGLDQKLTGDNKRVTVEIPFYLEKDQFADLLKLNLVFEGPGSATLSDIEVLTTPLEATSP